MNATILIMALGFGGFVVLSFLGTWMIRGRGFAELWPWRGNRPPKPPRPGDLE